MKRILSTLDAVLEQYQGSISLEAYLPLRDALSQAIAQMRREDCLELQQALGNITLAYSDHATAVQVSDQFRAAVERHLYPQPLQQKSP